MRRLLEVGLGCPKEMLYLELGCIPMRFTVMTRRIMFLHYILNEEQDSLINKVLQAQINVPSKNDFILGVEEDLDDLEIYLSLEDIKNLSKELLRNFIKQKVDEKALLFLNQRKLKHSKVLHIKHEKLEMQEYLCPSNVRSLELSKFLFSARTRMLDIGANFSNKYSNKVKANLDVSNWILSSIFYNVLGYLTIILFRQTEFTSMMICFPAKWKINLPWPAFCQPSTRRENQFCFNRRAGGEPVSDSVLSTL